MRAGKSNRRKSAVSAAAAVPQRKYFEPEYLLVLRDFPSVRVVAYQWSHWAATVEYSGFPEDLVAAAVMRPTWAEVGDKHPRDPGGGKVKMTRRWRSNHGQPRRYCVVRREIPLKELARWPGATDALKAHKAYRARRDQAAKASISEHQPAVDSREPKQELTADQWKKCLREQTEFLMNMSRTIEHGLRTLWLTSTLPDSYGDYKDKDAAFHLASARFQLSEDDIQRISKLYEHMHGDTITEVLGALDTALLSAIGCGRTPRVRLVVDNTR